MLPLTQESKIIANDHPKSKKHKFTCSKLNLFLFPPPTDIYPDFARNHKNNNKLWPYMCNWSLKITKNIMIKYLFFLLQNWPSLTILVRRYGN